MQQRLSHNAGERHATPERIFAPQRGSPASGWYCGHDRSWLCFPLCVHGIVVLHVTIRHRDHPGVRQRVRPVVVRNDHARMLRAIANDGLVTIPDTYCTVMAGAPLLRWRLSASIWPETCGSGLELRSRRNLLRPRGCKRARYGKTQAIIRRGRAGEIFNCRDFWLVIAPRARWAAPSAALQIAR